MRRGKIPCYWFSGYGYKLIQHLDLGIRSVSGWGSWDCAEHNFLRVHPRVKKLGLLTQIRKEDWYFDLIDEASHYVEGALIHRKDEWFYKWAQHIELECKVLGIVVPTYQKKKGKANV
tara:strand:- start:74 stop:427 length:354 start_codon:yes stop_codon:yes gene_type:complete